MPRGPKGEKRPGDVIGNAILIGRLATGDAIDTTVVKPPAKVKGGKAGGKARAAKLPRAARSAIAKKGANRLLSRAAPIRKRKPER
jgi:hypothetical protein